MLQPTWMLLIVSTTLAPRAPPNALIFLWYAGPALFWVVKESAPSFSYSDCTALQHTSSHGSAWMSRNASLCDALLYARERCLSGDCWTNLWWPSVRTSSKHGRLVQCSTSLTVWVFRQLMRTTSLGQYGIIASKCRDECSWCCFHRIKYNGFTLSQMHLADQDCLPGRLCTCHYAWR